MDESNSIFTDLDDRAAFLANVPELLARLRRTGPRKVELPGFYDQYLQYLFLCQRSPSACNPLQYDTGGRSTLYPSKEAAIAMW